MPTNGSGDHFPDSITDCHLMIAELRKQLRSSEEKSEEWEKLFRRMVEDFEIYRRRIEMEQKKAK